MTVSGDDLADAIETVRILRRAGLTAAEIIAAVRQPIPKGHIGNDDAIDAVRRAWNGLVRPEPIHFFRREAA